MLKTRVSNRIIPADLLIAWMMALGIYAKEFYLLPSGSLQIGDLFFLMAFAIAALTGRIRFERIDRALLLFVFLAVIVNLVYAIYYLDVSFLQYSVYLLFSLVIVLLARSFFQNECILRHMLWALEAALITQLLVCFAGFGRYFFDRYSGTFNDPNQFGYYALTCLFLIYTINIILGRKQNLLWFLVAVYLIVQSSSSSMILGVMAFTGFYVWELTADYPREQKWLSRIVMVLLAGLALLMLMLAGGFGAPAGGPSGLQRLLARLPSDGGLKGVFEAYIKDRSAGRILENPWGFLYGTGEGRWARYATGNEIHATMISLCFYYGFIPYLLWIFWLWSNSRQLTPALICVVAAQIIEAFTLANHRQPFFWILFVLVSNPRCKRRGKAEAAGGDGERLRDGTAKGVAG